ncbi:S1 family peptidase [Paenibacillus sp. FJAT-27812]|uniref:S1 family peptidase n=1 Tax=Paenibacillus sp. FJAT-27812 TaxID=1684143 RepID=UPI0006A7D2D1|nr:serine protease [Paenibacillus sp. FJAT-27812]
MKRTIQSKLLLACIVVSLLSCIVLFTGAGAQTPAIQNAEGIYENAGDAVFYLRALRSDGTVLAVGSGVVISADGEAATAYHVVKDAARLEAILADGSALKGVKLLRYDELTDAALLKLPARVDSKGKIKLYSMLLIKETALKHGERIFAIGYPLKNTPIITEGIVNNPKAEINGRDRVLVSAQVASGMSGGPAIDEQGRLAGIISGSLRTMNNIHLVIAASDLRQLMKT